MIRIKHIAMAVAFAATSVFGTTAVSTTASANEAQATKVADIEFQVQYRDRGYNRVCCKRGYRDWWSTYRQCRRSGGYVTANRACRWD